MTCVWIVHRREEERSWLAELPPLSVEVVSGEPGRDAFAEAPHPDGILLGLDDDWEHELAFALREGPRRGGTRWWLAGEPHQEEAVRRLFDSLPHVFLDLSLPSAALRARLHRDLEEASGLPLSRRRQRELLGALFHERFHDLDPELFLPLLDPKGFERPLLIAGETGLGKRLLARYLHAHTEAVPGAFLELDGRDLQRTEELWEALAGAAGRNVTLALATADALPASVQRALASHLELGITPVAAAALRWIFLSEDPERRMEDELLEALPPRFEIPPLRNRPAAVAAFARERIGSLPGGDENGAFAKALLSRRLRGNFRELESLLARAVEKAAGEPLSERHLRSDRITDSRRASGGTATGPEKSTADPGPAATGARGGEASLGAPTPIPNAPPGGAAPLERLGRDAPPGAGRGRHLPGLEETVSQVLGDGRRRTTEPAEGVPTQSEGEEEAPQPKAEEAATFSPSREAAETALAPHERPPERVSLGSTSLRSLSHALAHELRNPLSTVRTFATLFPEQHEDEAFRNQFGELVNADLSRIETALNQLQRFTDLPRQASTSIDFNPLVREILMGLRPRINERRLVVLEELDPEVPSIASDPKRLRFALGTIFERVLEWTREGGDLYVAVRRSGAPREGLNFSLRFQGGTAQLSHHELAPARSSLAFTLAEEIFGELGGVLRLDAEGGDGVVSGFLPRRP